MKKIFLFIFFYILILPTFIPNFLLRSTLVFANDLDKEKEFYAQQLQLLENEENDLNNSDVRKNTDEKKYYDELLNYSKKENLQSKSDVDQIFRGIDSYQYSSNLIYNGNFELGNNVGWLQQYLGSDGEWHVIDWIIKSGSGGYDNWYAYISGKKWLTSSSFFIPNSATDLFLEYNYRFVHWGTCTYGTNAVGVYLTNINTGYIQIIRSHYAGIDQYDYDYQFASTSIPNTYNFLGFYNWIEFISFNDDPNCTVALYLDNIDFYYGGIPEYSINTSAGSNGSISSGTTLEQGSNYIVYITPNTGYEISNVYVDGVSVGPVKYYNFINLNTNHSIHADFSLITSSSNRIYRFWGARGGRHFYTINSNEFTNVVNNYSTDIWNYEGIGYRAFASQKSNTIPLYRFWSDHSQGHFYTADRKSTRLNSSHT